MTTRSLARCALLAFLGGCAGARPAPPPKAAPSLTAAGLLPLAVGNRWTYRAEFLGAIQTLSVSIVNQQPGGFRDSRGQNYFVDPKGVRDDQRYLLKDPIALGQTWSSVVSMRSTEHYEVVAAGISVVVPAGQFEGCARIEGRNPQSPTQVLIAEQTYCLGVGLVQVQTFEETDGRRGPMQWNQELLAFRVANPTQ
jgi:hypothetical protein